MSITREQLEPGFWTKTTWIQIGYGIWVNQVFISIGLAFGFSAVALPQLNTPSSRIHSTVVHNAWIAGVLTLTAPIGCLISGFLMDRVGRRAMLILCMLPMTIGWLYTGFAKSAPDIIFGRFITGIGCGMASAPARAYGTEIALSSMRGVIGVIPSISIAVGIFIQASLGTWLRWEYLCYISGCYSMSLMLLNFMLPETPYYLLMKGSIESAKKTLHKFRSKSYRADIEIEEMKEYKSVNHIRSLTPRESFELLLTPASCKPFTIIMVYTLAGQLTGVTVLMFYAVEMLQDSKSSVNSYFGNVLITATRVLSCIVMSFLVYKIRRRTLALISACGLAVVCLTIGTYITAYDGTSVFPQIAYIIYVILASLGYYTLPLLMLFEMIPLQIRGLLGGISVSLINLMQWAANTAFPFVRRALGFPATIILMGMFSLLGWTYLLFFLPETKGLSLPEIEEYFNSKRPILAPCKNNLNRLFKHRSGLSRHKLTIVQKAFSTDQLHESKEKYSPAIESEQNLKRVKSSVTFVLDKTKKDSDDSEESIRKSDDRKKVNNVQDDKKADVKKNSKGI